MREHYSALIKASLSLILLASAPHSFAGDTTVYKRTMPDGSVSYSDQADNRAEKINVQPIPTVPALKVETPIDSKPEEALKPPYDLVRFTNPAHDSAFWSGNGSVNVQLEIKPALKSSHRIVFSMDGQNVATTQATAITMPLVDRGTHTLRADIVDAQGTRITSASSTFTIHRPVVRPPSINP